MIDLRPTLSGHSGQSGPPSTLHRRPRTMIPLIGVALCIGLGIAACAAPDDDRQQARAGVALAPPPEAEGPGIDNASSLAPDSQAPSISEISFPYVVQPACPGEGCTYGEWLACGAVPVYPTLGDASDPTATLEANERFEVLAGAVVVDAPGIVAVTRPSRPVSFMDGEDIFQPGDTLYVLDYIGEGFYNTWFQGAFYETDQFWPGPDYFTSDDYEYGGSVVQEVESGFWVQVRTPSQAEGWVDVYNARLAAANSLDPYPPACR